MSNGYSIATDFNGYHFGGCHSGGGKAPENVIKMMISHENSSNYSNFGQCRNPVAMICVASRRCPRGRFNYLKTPTLAS